MLDSDMSVKVSASACNLAAELARERPSHTHVAGRSVSRRLKMLAERTYLPAIFFVLEAGPT